MLRKFSALTLGGDPRAHAYGDVWHEEHTEAGPRLLVGASSSPITLMKALLATLEEPFGLLYVLMVSRAGRHQEARYQCPQPVSRQEMEAFLDEYRDYLESDGRHHLWVASLPGKSTVILDHHDILYLYGQLEGFQAVLAAHGLSQGTVEIPVPHRHSYHSEYDDWEDRIMAHWAWTGFPLQPVDDGGRTIAESPKNPPK